MIRQRVRAGIVLALWASACGAEPDAQPLADAIVDSTAGLAPTDASGQDGQSAADTPDTHDADTPDSQDAVTSIFCDDPCDDANPCTDDICYRKAGCTHVPHAGPCDDGNPCTWKDTCTEDTCHGVANPCDDGVACSVDSCGLPAGCTHSGC